MYSAIRSAVVLLGLAASAWAQTAGQVPPEGPTLLSPRARVIEFGVRGVGASGDRALYQRLRDLRDGPVLDRLRYQHERAAWSFSAEVDHLGYRNQRYLVQFERFDRLRVTGAWDEIPLFYSAVTRTPFQTAAAGVLEISDQLQGAIQNRQETIVSAGTSARGFDLLQQRKTADVRLQYDLTSRAAVHVGVVSAGKTGAQPWGAPFGFSAANQVALPLDQRTNDVNAALEWAHDRGVLRVAYDGSFFENDIQTLVFDNALRVTDLTSATAYTSGEGTSAGRMAIWPSNTAHTVSGLGTLRLPHRSQLQAMVSIGQWSQNERLLPFTINSAIAPIPLARPTAEAQARIVSTNLGFTSRPTNELWLSARYRLYDFDNRTPRFAFTDYVRMDQSVTPSVLGGSEPFGYTRQFVDLDASYAPLRHVAFRAGYGLEHDDRTFRFLERTLEHTVRASVDTAGFSALMVRGLYEYSQRTGRGLDEEALSDIGEQTSLRQFDISDRNRHRVSTIVQVMPHANVGLTGQLGVGRDTRPDTRFGLQENNFRFFNVGVDVTPGTGVSAGGSYGRENYDTLQRSRQANPGPQFEDPTRDWSTDLGEHVDNITAYVDLPHVAPRTSLSLGYDASRSRARYLYVLAPNTTIAPGPEQLPDVVNRLQHMQASVRYDLSSRVAIGVSYWYDRYSVDDFAYEALTEPFAYVGSGLFLGYGYRDFTAHAGWVRLMVNW